MLGIALALLSGRVLRGFLFGVSATDPVVLASVVVGVTLATLAACYVPVRRAVRVDPMVARRMTDNAGMRPMLKIFATSAVACALSVSLHGAAGVLIVETTTSTGAPSTNRIQLESNRMRAEATGPRGEKQIVIFDGAKQVLLMIDDQNKSYTELTKADADALGAQMSQAMAQVQKQLEGLPPEQRAQIESMMKGRMGGAGGAAPKTVYKRVGTGTVGKWTCTKYEGFEGETRTSELCTVDPKTFGLGEADFAVTKQFIEFFKRVVPAMATQMFSVGSAEQQGFEGVPVRRTSTVMGRTVTSEITEVSRQAFPDTSYSIPAGYQKRSFGSFGAPGRGGAPRHANP